MKRLLLITALITSFASLSHAAGRKVKSNKAFSIQPKDGGAPFIVVTGQVLELEGCEEEACIVKHKGESFKLPRLDLSSVRTRSNSSPSANTTYRRSTTSTTELGTSTTSRSDTDDTVRGNSSSSSFLSCYQQHQSTYTRIKWCGSGSNRYRCGEKSTSRSGGWCYVGVKQLLQRCGSSSVYLSGGEAKNAGDPLIAQGFRKLNTKDPRQAPAGSVIVYDNACSATHTAGHIEIKVSETKWISDFIATQPINEKTNCRPVKAIYFK